jgi:hypothetical protein
MRGDRAPLSRDATLAIEKERLNTFRGQGSAAIGLETVPKWVLMAGSMAGTVLAKSTNWDIYPYKLAG